MLDFILMTLLSTTVLVSITVYLVWDSLSPQEKQGINEFISNKRVQ